jgi:hypothetical protein
MSRNEQIKRELGVGQGTLRDKLRDYYDPFESRDAVQAASNWPNQAHQCTDFPFHPRPSWVWDADWPAVD